MKQNSSTKQQFNALKKGLLLFSFFAIALLTSKNGLAQQPNPGIFFTVTGNGVKDTSYLFGTYHLVNSSYLNDLSAVTTAFKKANGVVVEIIMDSSKLESVQEMGVMKDQLLAQLLEKPFLDSLDAELKTSIGVGIEQLNQLKPMNVTLTLSVVQLIKNNQERLKKYTGLPLDAFFAETGKQENKTVTALETIEGQMDLLFNSTSIEEQVKGLKAYIRNKAAMTKLGDELVESWFAHDLSAINTLYEKTLQLSGEEDKLIKERNLKWMKVLPKLLQQQSQFVAVGALHLAGEFGLVKQLQQQGYTVTPVKL